jgi:hypothetical protein
MKVDTKKFTSDGAKARRDEMIKAFVDALGEEGEPMVLIGARPHEGTHLDILNELNTKFSPDEILEVLQQLAEQIAAMAGVPQPVLDRVSKLINTLTNATFEEKGETHGRKIGFVDKTKVN